MASSSFSSEPQKFQVYLSFRGAVTHVGFTSHLYAALKREGINAYVDHQLERGEEISAALLRAIEESTISIIILSENYASSSWCLDELSKILECKKTMGQKVVPIYDYGDPSDVRPIRRRLDKVIENLQERFKDREDKVEGWMAALFEVAQLKGFHLRGQPNYGLESQVVEDIVQDILKKLRGGSLQTRYGSALEDETDVCFCVFNSKNCNSEWYFFEIPKSDSVSGKELSYPEGQVMAESMHATRGDSNLIKIGKELGYPEGQVVAKSMHATRGESNLIRIGKELGYPEGQVVAESMHATRGDSNLIKIRKQGRVATLSHKRHVNSVALGSIIYCIGIDKSFGIDKNIDIDESIGIDKNIGIDKSIGIYESIGIDENIGIGKSRIRNWPDHYASDVYCFDVNCPGQGWYLGRSMMAPRFLPDTLVMDVKLYVIGGVYAMGGVDAIDFPWPWVEVFDPITGKWEALPDPPPIIQESRLVYAACHDDGESKILVGTYDKNDSIYEYNVANMCWRQLPGHNMSFGYSGPAVAFDNKLYWFTETGHLFAYDLHQKLLYKGRVDKHLKDFDHHFKLIHLGGDQLCLLWITDAIDPKSDSDSDSDSDYEFESDAGFKRGSHFHCYKFEVSMGIKNGKAWLKACKNTSQSFIIDEEVSFVDGMLLNGWSGEELTRKRVELLHAKYAAMEEPLSAKIAAMQELLYGVAFASSACCIC